ncbi:MAG: adenylate kinase [bacterium]|jgi:adenylate kinase
MQLVLLGAPGAGKGTQGQLLEERFSLVRVATGDLLRRAIADGTRLGDEANAYMSRGELVPDELVMELVREKLQSPDVARGFILDGFPRNKNQAERLDNLLSEWGRQTLTAALYLEVDEAVLIARLTGRRICPNCGASFHLTGRPPKLEGKCDVCQSQLIQRPDDTEEVIRNRLQIYRRQTEPVLTFYETLGVLRRIDGNGSLYDIFGRILDILGAGKR